MIKQATLHDIDKLTPLFDAYRQFYHKQSDFDAAKDFLEARIENNESVIYIATNELNHFVGFVQLYPSFSSTRLKRFWVLNDLFVCKEFRGNGYSRELIEHAKQLCHATDACGMLLETSVMNEIGNNLYPSSGFQLRDDANFYEWETQPN